MRAPAAIPRDGAAGETVITGRRRPAGGKETHLNQGKIDMNTIKSLFATLLFSLMLAGAAFAAEKVNINTADAATLDRVLQNVGASKAEAIVAYRKANGPFKSPEQLAEVKGIGLRTVEQNRERIVVSAPRPAKAATGAAGAGRSTNPTR